ncbi:MAG: hypothetical protein J5928_04945 [Firmicutes bacterium]|nr:hypothetical protein [Bacillota bacterium]
MTKEELMEIIDIESGDEFTYFENLAAILESDENITSDALYQVLLDVDMHVFSELVESYFYDIMEHMPEDVDVYNLLETEKRNLIALSESSGREEDGALNKLADEIERFQEHFSLKANCEIVNNELATSETVPLRDAIYDYRISRLGKENRDYDVSAAADYEISEYIVNLGDLS